MDKETLVIHVSFQKNIPEDGKDFYFGSVASVFDFFSKTEIGTTPEALYYAFKGLNKEVFLSKNCVITKARLIRKKKD